MTDPNNVFLNFFNYINDPRNEKDHTRFITSRTLQGRSYDLETQIRFQYTGGCSYGTGFIGSMFFIMIKTPGGYVYRVSEDTIKGSIAEDPIVPVQDFKQKFLEDLVKFNPQAADLVALAVTAVAAVVEAPVPTSDDPRFLDRMMTKVTNVDAWNSDTYGKVTSYGTFEGHLLKVTFQHTVGSVFVVIENETNKDEIMAIVAPFNQNMQVHYMDTLEGFNTNERKPDWTVRPGDFDLLYELVSQHII